MSRRWVAIGVGVAALAGALWWFWPSTVTQDAVVDPGTAEAMDVVVEGGSPVRLFFPGGDGLLHMEERLVQIDPSEEGVDKVPSSGEASHVGVREALGAAVIRAVLEEPEQEGLRRGFDEGTTLESVRLTSEGTVIVLLQPPPGSVNRGLGSRAELLRIYSLVNSVVYSVPGVESVAIVWAGSQPATLGGHVDTSRPLFSSLDWVAGESRSALQAARTSQDSDTSP